MVVLTPINMFVRRIVLRNEVYLQGGEGVTVGWGGGGGGGE